MAPLQAKRHRIQRLQQFLNGNVPIAPIPTMSICQGLFLEIPLRLDEPVSCAITCVFHQVVETHLRRINY
jgi:hypothetical protein